VSDALALLVDPQEARRRSLHQALACTGCTVRDVEDCAQLARVTGALHPAIAIVAFSAGTAPAALAAVKRLRELDDRVRIIVVADEGSEALAVGALRAGAHDYFSEPLVQAEFVSRVRGHLQPRPRHPASERACQPPGTALIGRDRSMRQIVEYLTDLARSDSTVLITGETGTGKELAAAVIHDQSRRRRARFVSVNCAAIPDGLLESELFGYESGAFTGAQGRREGLLQLADKGTVFLDEVGDMGPQAQAKILRAIETREIYRVGGKRPVPLDIRIVAATNHDLERAVDEGRFRKDLYFRLNVARVHLPPLRERRSDIRALLDHYVERLNRERGAAVQGFSPETSARLERYHWPGNVRELKNLIEAIFVVPPSEQVTLSDLPAAFRARLDTIDLGCDAERQQLVEALLATNWNKSRAAEMLHWSRMTVYRKMAKHAVVRSLDRRVRREA
jgi:DNA-binding NtrC family response regulator